MILRLIPWVAYGVCFGYAMQAWVLDDLHGQLQGLSAAHCALWAIVGTGALHAWGTAYSKLAFYLRELQRENADLRRQLKEKS